METILKLTDKERLSFILQLKILQKLEPYNNTYKDLCEALSQGFTIHYNDLQEEFLDEEMPAEQCRLVLDILEMYRGLIFSAYSLQWKKLEKVKFPGFDCNDPEEVRMCAYATYFLEDLQRYDEIRELSNHDYNSHCPMLSQYRKMLLQFKEIPAEKRYSMTEDQINNILEICK